MDTTINTLRIEIGASTDEARRKIDEVVRSLRNLKSQSKQNVTTHRIKVDSKDVDKAHKKVGALSNILNSLKRIAFYRVIRSAIKAVGEAFSEGAERAYWYSKTLGDQTKYIADAYDTLASKSFTMTNQLGASWATLKATIAPILLEIIRLVTAAASVITQLFAILGGKTTFLKATDYTKDWADATASGAASAKEWKNQLMGFDEINRLDAPNEGGRGGGSKKPTDYENMFEEAEVAPWLQNIKSKMDELKNSLNFDYLKASWASLGEQIKRFGQDVVIALGWVWDNILVPLAHWQIEKNLPAQLDLLAKAFDFVLSVAEKLAPVFDRLWHDILQPFVAWIGERVVKAIEDLGNLFGSLAEKVKNADSLGEFIMSLDGKEKIFVSIATAVTALAGGLAILGIAKTVVSGLSTAFSLLVSPAGIAILAIGALVLVGIELYQKFESVREKFDEVGAKFSEFKERFKEPAYWAELGTSIVEALSTAIGAAIGSVAKVGADIGAKILEGLKQFFFGDTEGAGLTLAGDGSGLRKLGESIVEGLQGGITEKLKSIGTWIKSHIFEPFITGFKEAFGIHSPAESMKPFGENIWEGVLSGITDALSSIGTWVLENIWNPFKNGIKAIFGIDEANANLNGYGANIITGLKNGITNALTGIGDWIVDSIWTPLCEGFNTILEKINEWWQGTVSFVNDAIQSINDFISGNDEHALKIEADGSIWLQGFANGGFPEDGLFMANHGELVGGFSNGRTAVANNEQITEGIREAVFDAFVSAMSISGGNNGQPIEIYLDGHEIARSTTKYQRQFARASG